jgi:integrase
VTRRGAGRDGVMFHALRRTYASTLLSGGVSVAAAADYLGHSPAAFSAPLLAPLRTH